MNGRKTGHLLLWSDLMELFIVISSIIGAVAGGIYLIEKVKGIPWRKVKLSRLNLSSIEKNRKPWPEGADVSFPEEIRTAVDLFYPDFRLPDPRDIQGDWALYGDPETLFPFLSSGKYLCKDDQDYALFILGREKEYWKAIVFTRTESGQLTPLELMENTGSPRNMFVRTVEPGRYRTAYGKGYDLGEREKGPRTVELTCDGVNLGTFESADALYYWDKAREGFVEVWMSD